MSSAIVSVFVNVEQGSPPNSVLVGVNVHCVWPMHAGRKQTTRIRGMNGGPWTWGKEETQGMTGGDVARNKAAENEKYYCSEGAKTCLAQRSERS